MSRLRRRSGMPVPLTAGGALIVLLLLILVPVFFFGGVSSSLERAGAYTLSVAFPELTFTRPVDLQHAGDGTGRLFVVEQAGRIRVIVPGPQVRDAPVFLDLTDRVNSRGNEEGLLGLAFHPDYQDNGFFFVDYTASNPRRTVVARFSVRQDDPDRADAAHEKILLEVPQPYGNHNGGQIAFGPDGYLYVALGDGGSGGDPHGNGQNRKTLLGALLRIDVDTAGIPYGIPADNPFVGNDQGWREEIFAYGLRNPWRFSFDPETGRLWAGDVGQNRYEEVDLIEKGGNYGWNVLEGFHCYESGPACRREGMKEPVFEYGRRDGSSITGGYVYRGPTLPDLNGTYLFADYVSGRVWSLALEDREVRPKMLVDSGLNISSFGVDEEGKVYLCAFDGRIYRFERESRP